MAEMKSLRALLDEYRAACIARDAAEERFDAEEAAIEEEQMLLALQGYADPKWRRESGRRLDDHVERWHGPVDNLIGRIRATVCLMHGIDPRERRIPKPVAAILPDGTIVVARDDSDDVKLEGLEIVDPRDVAMAMNAEVEEAAKARKRKGA